MHIHVHMHNKGLWVQDCVYSGFSGLLTWVKFWCLMHYLVVQSDYKITAGHWPFPRLSKGGFFYCYQSNIHVHTYMHICNTTGSSHTNTHIHSKFHKVMVSPETTISPEGICFTYTHPPHDIPCVDFT